MRRFVLTVPLLLTPALLGGCTGFGSFLAHSFSLPGTNPNRPAVDSENVRRAYGRNNPVDPLMPEKGNVWPGPQGPDPTLTDIENQQNQNPNRPTATLPAAPGSPNANRQRGSSTPPDAVPPRSSGPGGVPALPPAASPGVTAPPRPGGTVFTPRGNGTDAGGTSSYRQLTTPNAPGAIVVPNGNGTSTVISPDGGVQVIPTPR